MCKQISRCPGIFLWVKVSIRLTNFIMTGYNALNWTNQSVCRYHCRCLKCDWTCFLCSCSFNKLISALMTGKKKGEWNPAIHKNRALRRSDWPTARSWIIHHLLRRHWPNAWRTGPSRQSARVCACGSSPGENRPGPDRGAQSGPESRGRRFRFLRVEDGGSGPESREQRTACSMCGYLYWCY